MRRFVLSMIAAGVAGCFSPGESNADSDDLTSSTTNGTSGPELTTSITQTTNPTDPGDDTTTAGTAPTTTGVTTSDDRTGGNTESSSESGEDTADTGSSTDDTTAAQESTTTTGPADPVRVAMFGSESTNGNVRASGGQATARASADALCAAALDDFPGLQCDNVHAMLSISAADELRDMPANYGLPEDLPIEGPTGTSVDDDFAALLDGDLANSLVDAGVFSGPTQIWTGSGSDGAVLNTTCAGWTATDAGGPDGAGGAGTSDSTTGTWLSIVSALCTNSLPLVCACW